MNRVIFSLTALLGALMPLVFDSALKGAALLGIAAFCALLLHRASAATRHLVWLAAIVALLVVPVLSVALPQWRVLPGWAVVRPLTAASGEVRDRVLPSDTVGGAGAVVVPPLTAVLPANPSPSAELPVEPVSPAPAVASDPVRTWHDWLAPVWGVGFTFLALRLLAAHLLLRCAMRGCRVVRATPGNAETDGLAAQLDAACVQLGIRQRVTLLLDERRTIPVVWGVFRPRLMLPAEALEWSDEQVRSVLLHELAHIQRRDTLVQWLTHIACALHWWNPLVWLAAWRLHAERERACDDLVLASGVRPSTYAEHLLHVATKLSTARWTSACGLAMARNSSLEGRLLAVLSQKLNRRGTTRALAATTLAVGTLIAVPLAMLRAADEGNPPPAKLAAGPTLGSADRADAPAPRRKEARALYENWQRLARANGDIPGALVGELAAAVRQFIRYNPTWETVPKLNAILPRLDAARDWKTSDAIAMLDEVAAVQDSPLDMPLWRVKTIRPGEKLPQEFAGLDWRGPANGPRVAWVLEPASLEHRFGAALKARLLVWNPGPAPVAMQVPTFHQGGVTANNAEGVAVQVSGIDWTTLGESVPVRLRPSEYVEINTPGVGLGKTAGREPWAGPRVGFHVLVTAGEEVTLTHSPVPLDGSEGGIRDGVPPVVGAGWWLAHIQARLSRELPLPPGAVEREHLLQRVVNELFEASPTGEEMAAFTTDQTSGALDALARRLAERTGAVEFAGKLAPAPIRFRVLAADPAAAEGPRVVLGPGEYPIGKGATLRIVGRPDGERYVYDTTILFEPAEVTGKLPPDPHKIEMPGDRATWAIVCRPGAGHFYVLHRGTARKIDYTNPLMVTDAPATDLPAGFRDEAKRQLDLRGVSAESQAEVFEKPAPPAAAPAPKARETGPRADAQPVKARGEIAKLTPDALLGAWRGTVNQEKLMLSFHRPPAEQGVQCDIYFGEATIGALARFVIADDGGSAEVIQHSAGGGMKFGTLLPIEPGKLKLELYGRQKGQQEVILVRNPERAYPKVGVPIGDVEAHMEWSAIEQDGLCVGMRIAEDAEWYVGGEVKVELWACNSGQNDVRFQYCPRRDIGLRVSMKGPDGKEHVAAMRQYRGMPSFHRVLLPGGHMFKLKEFSVVLLPPGGKHDGAEPHFTLPAGDYQFRCEVDLPGTTGANAQGQQVTPAEGEWTGKLRTSQFGAKVGAAKEAKNQAPSDPKLGPGRDVMALAPDAPAPKPRVENMDVDITQDGEVALFGKKMPLAELKSRAARSARKWFSISAGKEVPHAKVVEVVDALKAAGVTEFSFRDAQMGDGRYRVANRQAVYKLDGNHSFSICRPGDYPQYFTVGWPAEGERPACWLRTYPNVNGQTQGKWAVVWEPGKDVLWWVDDSDVGKMTITDPAHVIVDREGRRNNFSADFGLPAGVVTEFRRLGFEIGRDKGPGVETPIGGNTGGQSIVSAVFGAWIIQGRISDADGRPLKDVQVRVAANEELKTGNTNAKGEYEVTLSLPLRLLAHWRAVTVEPVLEGFTERDMAKAGEFNVLLRAGELPQHVRLAGDESFRPGPIARFAERDLIPSKPGVSPGTPGRADFVMLQAGEITGEIVTANGMPAPSHFIAATTREARPGRHAALEKSDALGRFRLKGIPTNKPVVLTVNPDGKPRETSQSPELRSEDTGKYRIRIILPTGGSGNGPVKVERVAGSGV